MTSRFNQRWLIGGAIWLVALIMTVWNFSLIERVGKMRDNSERLRRESAFQLRNTDKLHQVQELYASHYKEVASVKLGFESVRSSLHALAALLGLEDVKIESVSAQASDAHMPFTARMQGDYQKAMGFVSALLKYPYLSIKHSRIIILNPQGHADIDIVLDFHFRTKPQQTDEPSPLQASAPPPSPGVLSQ